MKNTILILQYISNAQENKDLIYFYYLNFLFVQLILIHSANIIDTLKGNHFFRNSLSYTLKFILDRST